MTIRRRRYFDDELIIAVMVGLIPFGLAIYLWAFLRFTTWLFS